MTIVIPTYKRHISYNFNFLKSFASHCLDKRYVDILLIVKSSEYDIFKKLTVEFPDLNLKIIKMSDLLFNVDQKRYSDEAIFFESKYPITAIKKLFAYSVIDGDYIVLDSENLCLKDFYFSDLFQELKNMPLIYCSDIYADIQRDVLQTSNSLIDFRNNEKWFFLKSYWFFEKQHVVSLIEYLKKLHKEDLSHLFSSLTFF